MTGRERLLAAFEPDGTPEIGVVSCYDSLFVRDHWSDLTDVPWWYRNSGLVEYELAWMRDVRARAGLDWLTLGLLPFSRQEREHHRYEDRPDGVWRVDTRTGKQQRLAEPLPGGSNTSCAADRHCDPDGLPRTREEIDAVISLPPPLDCGVLRQQGRHDVAEVARASLDVALGGLCSSPLTMLYSRWGFEGMMLLVGESPELAAYAAERMLSLSRHAVHQIAAMELDFVFIEEFFTDQISRQAFCDLNVPLMRNLVEEIRSLGLKSIYYYCGNPNDRLDLILQIGADAVHFEESKKGFSIELDKISRSVDGRCVLFGNLDAIAVLQDGSVDQLRSEIARQIAVGRRNRSRFVMSTGSPITPGTPVGRVAVYSDSAREIGRGA